MKKISLFVCAVSLATLATAQEAVQNVNELRTLVAEKPNFVKVQMNQPMDLEPFNAESVAKQKAAAAQYYASDYYYCDGMLHGGLTKEFRQYAPMIFLPYMDSVVWQNAVGNTTWKVNDKTVAENTKTYTTGYGVGGIYPYYLPKTSDHTYSFEIRENVDTTVNVAGYIYGESRPTQYLWSATGDYWPMTLCGMWADTVASGNGRDCYMVGGAEGVGEYAYGTGITVSEGLTADTLGVIVRNLGTMKIDQIYIPIYNSNDQGISTMLPNGASVKVAIYAADLTQGHIYTNNLLAETTVSAADFTAVDAGMGMLTAKFYETNILGVENQVPIVIDGDFYLELTNFNETKCDFGIFSDYYTVGGTTLYRINGEYTTFWRGGGNNLAITFDAYYPTLFNDTTANTLNVSLAGGVAAYDNGRNYVGMFTNVNPVNGWEIDAPDWVEYVMDTTALSNYGMVLVQITAEAYTDGAGREGEFVITADDAVEYTLIIKQGTVTAIDQTKYLFDNKRYNLLGIEVDENYKGVVIRNGEKFIQ